jgi:transposase
MREYKKQEQSYTSDVSNSQREEIKPLFSNLREYKWPKRELLDAVLYIINMGCQLRQLPHDFPPCSTVHSFYRRARKSGLWDLILEHLIQKIRENAGRSPNPTYALLDSQSVKTVAASEERGIDGGKNERQEAAYRCRRHGESARNYRTCGKYP